MSAIILAAIIGKVIETVGKYEEGMAQSDALQYESYLAGEEVKLIEKAGRLEEGKARTRRRRLLSRQVALAAASGQSISGGSPLALIEAGERAGLQDEKIINFNKHMALGAKRSDQIMLLGASKATKVAAKLGLYTGLFSAGAKAYQTFGGKTTTTEPNNLKTFKATRSLPKNPALESKPFNPLKSRSSGIAKSNTNVGHG